MMITFSSKSDQPSDTIDYYLDIKLNKEHPFISVKKKKVTVQANIADCCLKRIVDQENLFKKIIIGLKDQTSLISFSSLEISDQTIISSSSSESVKKTKKLSGVALDGFDAHLESIQPSKTDLKIDYHAKIILASAKNKFFIVSEGDSIKDKFCRKTLANALKCHVRLYIKPLYLVKDVHQLKRKQSVMIHHPLNNHTGTEKSQIIKALTVDTFNHLISYWLTGETDVKKLKKIRENSLGKIKKIDRKNVEKHDLFEPANMLEILQESVLRNLDCQHDLGADIIRQMSYIQIHGKNGQIFSYKKNSVTADEDPSLFFEQELHNFKNMIAFFLTELSAQVTKKLILDEIDSLAINVEKTFSGLSELYVTFLEHIRSNFLEYANLEFNSSARNLYYLLLTLTQKTYVLPALPITQKILKNFSLKYEPGEKSRVLLYILGDNTIKLNVSAKFFSEQAKFELCILNNLSSNIEDSSMWTSAISLQVLIQDENKKGHIQKNVIEPLKLFGFPVTVC